MSFISKIPFIFLGPDRFVLHNFMVKLLVDIVLGWNRGCYLWYYGSTLDSGIDVAPGINVAPRTFGKNIKHSP